MDNRFYEQLCACVGKELIRVDEPMRNHTTFRIGGQSDYFVMPTTPEQVKETIRLCREQNINWYVIGNGSNLLVGDAGYRGAIIQIGKNMSEIKVDGCRIKAGAGALLSKLGAAALTHSLTGMEFASGIPGTVGGAVVMNAGAYGGEIKQILTNVTVLNADGEIVVRKAEELRLAYRTSALMENREIVLEVELLLANGDTEKIKARMEELRAQRTEKQPLDLPSAGSTFKRPEGYFAGKLIMDAGLRGFRIGDAMVSEKHCGFVVNAGQATAKDVRILMQTISEKVYEQFQVKLEAEVKFLGEFEET